jgi:hypothetical protein
VATAEGIHVLVAAGSDDFYNGAIIGKSDGGCARLRHLTHKIGSARHWMAPTQDRGCKPIGVSRASRPRSSATIREVSRATSKCDMELEIRIPDRLHAMHAADGERG